MKASLLQPGPPALTCQLPLRSQAGAIPASRGTRVPAATTLASSPQAGAQEGRGLVMPSAGHRKHRSPHAGLFTADVLLWQRSFLRRVPRSECRSGRLGPVASLMGLEPKAVCSSPNALCVPQHPAWMGSFTELKSYTQRCGISGLEEIRETIKFNSYLPHLGCR